jgi:uncharacterized membrane-anchored protein
MNQSPENKKLEEWKKEIQERVFEIMELADKGLDKKYGHKGAELIIYLSKKIPQLLSQQHETLKAELLKEIPLFNSWANDYEKNKAAEDSETGRNPVLREVREIINKL